MCVYYSVYAYASALSVLATLHRTAPPHALCLCRLCFFTCCNGAKEGTRSRHRQCWRCRRGWARWGLQSRQCWLCRRSRGRNAAPSATSAAASGCSTPTASDDGVGECDEGEAGCIQTATRCEPEGTGSRSTLLVGSKGGRSAWWKGAPWQCWLCRRGWDRRPSRTWKPSSRNDRRGGPE